MKWIIILAILFAACSSTIKECNETDNKECYYNSRLPSNITYCEVDADCVWVDKICEDGTSAYRCSVDKDILNEAEADEYSEQWKDQYCPVTSIPDCAVQEWDETITPLCLENHCAIKSERVKKE